MSCAAVAERPIRTVCRCGAGCLPCSAGGCTTGPDTRAPVAPHRQQLAAGETLFSHGAPFQHLYAVRSGTLKSVTTGPGGLQQVCGFHMAGDLVALDGLHSGRHDVTTTALHDTEVCRIDYATLLQALAHDSALQHRVLRAGSREIARGQRLMLLLGVATGPERLAAFLLDLSQRFAARGYSAREFTLAMPRADIGSFLGLTLETISRLLARLQRSGLLEVDYRRIRFPDLPAFERRYEAMLKVG